jgi:CRP/FNR family transcriptional regulator, cyclic AMP receptor protein
MTLQERLCRHTFLAALTGAEAREVLAHAQVRRFPARKVVFRNGDAGDGLYGVLSGRIHIVAGSMDGKELILNTHGPGEVFGEIALLDGQGRSATAMANEASELLFLGRAAFLAFVGRRPEAMARIAALLCARLRRGTTLLEDYAFLELSPRLAKLLAGLAEARGTATLSLSQRELAQMLGVTREFVSKQLNLWREAGIVELGRRRITIREPGALRQLCQLPP